MTAKDIDNKLRSKFVSHKYELSNSYVFNWESDFFSISSTGYCQEIEVKVSYSDFKADFIKTSKHNLLRSAFLGCEKYCWSGNLEYKVNGFYNRRGIQEPFERIYTRSNRNDESNWKKRGWNFEQISSEISIRDIDLCPNPTRYKPRKNDPLNWHEAISKEAYEIADSMLKLREKL